jgi:16S rRNA (adenine1518-N6/adenine1519-N6)-dimethyltransferase
MSIKPRKQFGQHWLRNEQVLNKIIQAANLTSSTRVLEIGPGTGILTQKLLTTAGAVVSVEIDRDLCPKLVKKFGDRPNFILLQGDFLTLNIEEQLTAFPTFQHPTQVVANIPYNITGPILEKLLGTIQSPNANPYQSIVLLIQKEVAERLSAKPSTKAYGSLTVKVQYLADCELVCPVKAQDFYPPPKVDSAVVKLTPRKPTETPLNPKLLDQLVRLGFSSRRKMLRNNLQSLIDRDTLTNLLGTLDINGEVRAEDLSLDQWINLCNKLTPLTVSPAKDHN